MTATQKVFPRTYFGINVIKYTYYIPYITDHDIIFKHNCIIHRNLAQFVIYDDSISNDQDFIEWIVREYNIDSIICSGGLSDDDTFQLHLKGIRFKNLEDRCRFVLTWS